MYSDDKFLNAYESWKMGTHLQTLGVAAAIVVAIIGIVVEIVRFVGGGEGAAMSVDAWLIAFGFSVVIPIVIVVCCLPVNALAYSAVLRSARHRRRTDPESYRTVVVPALEDTHGVPGFLMRLYRRVGMDPLQR